MKKLIKYYWKECLVWLGLKRRPLISSLTFLKPNNYEEMIKLYPDLVKRTYINSKSKKED